jgi:hypothetical protein
VVPQTPTASEVASVVSTGAEALSAKKVDSLLGSGYTCTCNETHGDDAVICCGLQLPELKALCKARGLPVSGSKAQLVERLMAPSQTATLTGTCTQLRASNAPLCTAVLTDPGLHQGAPRYPSKPSLPSAQTT